MKTPSVEPAIPAGYRQDRQGRLVPENGIKPIDLVRDDLVTQLITQAKQKRQELIDFKRLAFSEIASFVSLSAGQYNVHIGGEKGNVTLFSFDGRYKIVRAIQELIRFDERLQAAKSLIEECLKEATENVDPEFHAVIYDAFSVDAKGNISTAKVLGLRRYKISDHRWLKAMEIISDATEIIGTATYVRFYERDARGNYLPIPLSLAEVG